MVCLTICEDFEVVTAGGFLWPRDVELPERIKMFPSTMEQKEDGHEEEDPERWDGMG